MEARWAGCAVREDGEHDESISHMSWECVCHIVWIPKYRRKVLYGEARREIGGCPYSFVKGSG